MAFGIVAALVFRSTFSPYVTTPLVWVAKGTGYERQKYACTLYKFPT